MVDIRPPTEIPPSISAPPTAVGGAQTLRVSRPEIVGPDVLEPPFPIPLRGCVQRGFGRGGKELGCPTANLPDESLPPLSAVKTGVYFGYAQVIPPSDETASTWTEDDKRVLPMVMSLGWNPFYKNERLSAEVHIMHEFNSDFYELELRVVVLGYIRPELDYISREALIEDIETDKKVGLNSLARPAYQRYAGHEFANLWESHESS